MRRGPAGGFIAFVVTLAVALSEVAAVGADAVPQRPSQIAFNARVGVGTELVVADSATGGVTSSPLCTTMPSLKAIWAQAMAGQDVATADCAGLPSASRVRVLRKTRAYTVDDPSQDVAPYGNDAHLIVEVRVLSVPPATGPSARDLVGRTGYMVVDDLAWPRSK